MLKLESLLKRQTPDESLIGIVLAAVSLVVMPLLVRAKRKVARSINRAALMADSKQTELCTYLSAILLGGLLLNALLRWWWVDLLTLITLLLGVILIGIQVRLEEEYLMRTHGDEYIEYRHNVSRWI